ncbi:hypothetical protein [Cecembia sp.]|uniref:hypothetical protein n=1 Tax=Cecembia sp. TaxID=1898110 RepID=UPI0025C27A40|nr:hypothetical protein [Cecembia sp.]
MHLKTEDLIRLEIDFDSGLIPPPYSHTFKLKIGFGKNFLDTTLDLMYTDREELTAEEIFDEGFTEDDDFHFHGEVPKVWEEPLKSLYSKSKWSNNKVTEDGGIRVLAKDRHGKISRTVPLNQQEWQLFTQDYIQAIYESSKKERPLQIQYLIREKDRETHIQLTMKFLLRKVEVNTNGKIQEADWEATKELLSFVFLPDYDYEKAKEQKPKNQGQFIECGDGYWHEMGKGVINIDDSFDAVAKIKAGFQKIS